MLRMGAVAIALSVLPLGVVQGQRAEAGFDGGTRAFTRPTKTACDSATMAGADDARLTHSTKGWKVAGFMSGIAFSAVGVAGATLVANADAAEPPSLPPQVDAACYRKGYRSESKRKSRGSAFKSAVVGALIFPVAWLGMYTMR